MEVRVVCGKGFSLIETIVALAVISVLLGLAVYEFSRWLARYGIERQTRDLYAQLQRARFYAMYKNRSHFFKLEKNGYSITSTKESFSSESGGGNDETVVQPYTEFKYPVDSGSVVKFDSRGLVPLNNARTICINSNINPDLDCIVIHRVRMNMGKIRRQSEACVATNCLVK